MVYHNLVLFRCCQDIDICLIQELKRMEEDLIGNMGTLFYREGLLLQVLCPLIRDLLSILSTSQRFGPAS